jgi:SOS-response transcriptional repressor LexA
MLPLTKRQREILDYLNEFISQHGYAPSLEEIGRRFGLSSLATVHKHLTNLQEKGFIKRGTEADPWRWFLLAAAAARWSCRSSGT